MAPATARRLDFQEQNSSSLENLMTLTKRVSFDIEREEETDIVSYGTYITYWNLYKEWLTCSFIRLQRTHYRLNHVNGYMTKTSKYISLSFTFTCPHSPICSRVGFIFTYYYLYNYYIHFSQTLLPRLFLTFLLHCKTPSSLKHSCGRRTVIAVAHDATTIYS